MRSLEWLHENFHSNHRPYPDNVAHCNNCDWSLRVRGHDVLDILPQLEQHLKDGHLEKEPDVWSALTPAEQDEYATLTLDYWYLTRYPEKRARLNELLLLVQERTENEQRTRRDRKDPL